VDGPPNAEPWPDDHVLTPFQQAVVDLVGALEPGELVSFADVAAELGRPRSAQAVANVLRAAPDLPWWRVVPSDGRVYRSHRSRQVPLLRAEGHDVADDGRIARPAAG
jgi:methylated-DNA-protein-cysteine methyltransferase-like protein